MRRRHLKVISAPMALGDAALRLGPKVSAGQSLLCFKLRARGLALQPQSTVALNAESGTLLFVDDPFGGTSIEWLCPMFSHEPLLRDLLHTASMSGPDQGCQFQIRWYSLQRYTSVLAQMLRYCHNLTFVRQ